MESIEFIDEESKKLVRFWDKFNVIYTIFSISIIIIGFLVVATAKNEISDYEAAKIALKSDYYSASDDVDDVEYSDIMEAKNEHVDGLKWSIAFSILIIGSGYVLLQYKGIQLLVKHFANVAETKGLQNEIYKLNYAQLINLDK
ncbi:hypothetical protein HZR21_08485 [Lactococcus laudensis]|uniref:Uncharacterized protein n=1 Tax=Pseudolactococcus laudensis TaxID=1494461 RepID=A0A7V8N217_9LACT|nr:hypothetical protein [Lactococcus laudensis]MBA0017154.1 hypothetical protein [Lactococcus laudensis]MBW9281908.1 hypothetical protein [Lactococcus laudensis]